MNVFSTLKKAAAVLCIACISVMAAEPLVYTIVGSNNQFTARVGDPREGAVVAENQPIWEVINAIRDHAQGEDCTIQFGVNNIMLNLVWQSGRECVIFDGGDFHDDWGKITLRGRITSNFSGGGTINLRNGVSVENFADVENTLDRDNSHAIKNESSGTLTISGGTIATTGRGAVISNAFEGRVIINNGTIQALGSAAAVFNSGSGNVLISDNATITAIGNSAVHIANAGTLEVTGGTIKNTANGYAIESFSTRGITISGGTIESAIGVAIGNEGLANIEGGIIRATSTGGRGVFNTGTLNINGGKISTTDRYAVRASGGLTTISGGEITATIGNAVEVAHLGGRVIISEVAQITSANTSDDGGAVAVTLMADWPWSPVPALPCLEILGGVIKNTGGGNAVYSNSDRSAMIVKGGTIESEGFAILSTGTHANNTATLEGNPDIKGRIRTPADRLRANALTSAERKYTLDFATYTNNAIAVVGGANFLSNFVLHEKPDFALRANNNNLVLRQGVDITAEIKDDNFRAAVYGKLGKVAPEPIFNIDVDTITRLNLRAEPSMSRSEQIELIRNLDGIEYFVSLRFLDVSGHEISELDLSKNIELEHLNVSGNQLTRIDITQNLELRYLNVEDNRFVSEKDIKGNTTEIDEFIFGEQRPVSINNARKSDNRHGIRFAQNIVSDKAEISVVLPASAGSATEISVVIYDMTGNVVWASTGSATGLSWDLRNQAGRFVANGTYLVVVEARDRNGKVCMYSARLGVRR